MTFKQCLRASCAALTAVAFVQAPVAVPAHATPAVTDLGEAALVQSFVQAQAGSPFLQNTAKAALLQQRVKYVFVLFQENRSFDQHFGTFPGADGLFSKPASQTPGFVQPIVNIDGTAGTISPFLIPQSVTDKNGATVPLYPADTDSVDHSHTGINNGMHVDGNLVSSNDRYALDQEGFTTLNGQIVTSSGTPLASANPPSLARKQQAELVMSHLDCDTIPFLWQYADRFTLYDNFHQTIIGPSTPNAIALIAGQSGQTQWALHPSQSAAEPVLGDPNPYVGGPNDPTTFTAAYPKPPYGPNDIRTPALNQTYASLPLSFEGPAINTTLASDPNPTVNQADIRHDIPVIAARNKKTVPWGWYQEGYDHEPTDGTGATTFDTYITHHNGPQYFGYVGDNPKLGNHLHGLGDFFTDMTNQALPSQGGVFYVRGGYGNNDGLVPVDPTPHIRASFAGSDDHPAYSDAQISEALLADEINAIASSPYWKDSAIIITYDETDGLYDHAVPQIRSLDPAGAPLAGGPRIPTVVISPYAVAHRISHAYGEHSSVIRFIDLVYGLVPLAELPDELNGRYLGRIQLNRSNLGPADALVPNMSNLSDAFDNGRLLGTVPPLPASYATIDASVVQTLPHYAGAGCHALGITPTDYVNGVLIDPPPPDFNPRPGSAPGTPTSGTWTP